MRLEENTVLPWLKNSSVLCFQQLFPSEVQELSSKSEEIILYIQKCI